MRPGSHKFKCFWKPVFAGEIKSKEGIKRDQGKDKVCHKINFPDNPDGFSYKIHEPKITKNQGRFTLIIVLTIRRLF